MSQLVLPASFRVIGLDLSSQQEVAHVFTTADWREAVTSARAAGALPLSIAVLDRAGRPRRTWRLDLDGNLQAPESLLMEHPIVTVALGILLFFAGALVLGVLLRAF
ncbi:MAG: hypothetical protein IT436_03365 [Phycisphaerales bacterium]|nr:hypothetical protein [Phycisphaerales bacterium]